MDIAIGAAVLAGIGIWLYRRHVPARGMKLLNAAELPQLLCADSSVQLLDVRDYLEYEAGHYPNAINISLGRLSLTWHKHLDKNKPVILLASAPGEAYSAARYLKRKGFRIDYWVICHASSQDCTVPHQCCA
ncbi:rhodanese-like domain-containing protein [Paenibacillus xerothermodurans]|uniref:Rhodanese-like domain-containing protein n=1 Tax=Paenibacillus xerothermodurans TaxID=1977292 RepID=A0A2W1NB59_PAEXE|nr:rhodanese-like domain-containing protein [Paenibacillus xerothermodurans]PZE20900.1 rhodanese-like domain-containing protein [Paenibacillus xerothermodurans]